MKFQAGCVVDKQHGLPVYAEVDVLVAGGGAAGVAAAEAAGARGQSVMIVERYGFLGGAAVAGLSGTVCGMYLASEKNKFPEQLVYGFADRFCQELKKRHGLTEPQIYGKTWVLTHDPLVWREAAESFLLQAGVEILYHTNITGVIKENDAFMGVIIDTKAGRAAIHAKILIDATGDADLVYRAGLSVFIGENGKVQSPTMIFRLSGVDIEKFIASWGTDTISPPAITEKINSMRSHFGKNLPRNKIWVFPTPRSGELLVNATLIKGIKQRDLDVILPKDYTEAEILGRRQVRAYEEFFQKNIDGCEESFVNDTAIETGIRQTRSIVGRTMLTNQQVLHRQKRSDGIAKSSWPIELHAGESPKLEWILDDYYEVPFGALLPEKGENIIVAGRCLCAEHEALASSRVTAQCFQYGEAAGIAASLAIKQSIAIHNVDPYTVRKFLSY